jgi:putative SOS response-associated peptidase YedK
MLTNFQFHITQIHDRLALILHPKDYDRWLGIPMSGDPRPPLDLLHPYDATRMKLTPANPAVGNWRNNDPRDAGRPKIKDTVKSNPDNWCRRGAVGISSHD